GSPGQAALQLPPRHGRVVPAHGLLLPSHGPPPSVISGLDQPAAVLYSHKPGSPVLGDQLESGPPARGAPVPPPLGNRPRPRPGGDPQPRPAAGRHPRGRRRDQPPTAHGPRDTRPVGDPCA